MDYFEETQYYQRDDMSMFSKETLDELDAIMEEYVAESKKENELVMTDEYLYKNIDKVLETPNLTYLLINFSNTPVQEDVLLKLAQIETLCKLEISFMFSNINQLPEAIFELTSLKILHISNIKMTKLSDSISKLKNLVSLTVIQTEITTLPKSIGELTNLMTLEVELNDINHLPSSIGKLKNLTHLDLFFNDLSELPESIGNLSLLRELNLSLMPSLKKLPESLIALQKKNPYLKIDRYTDDNCIRVHSVDE